MKALLAVVFAAVVLMIIVTPICKPGGQTTLHNGVMVQSCSQQRSLLGWLIANE